MPEVTSSSTRNKPYSGFEQLFIGGTWRNGRSHRVKRHPNPWTGEVLAEISQATKPA